MGGITHNLRLNVPDFDQAPWDVDVNTNWLVLDATVGMFAAIPNLTGVWKNATEYVYGQSAIDPADSSIWQCVQTHTSTALPTTFAQERVLYPARWSMTNPGAQFYAEQAAAAAADAAQSAQEAADAAAAVGGGALLKSGGTMTGPLILAADPSALLGAATKQYVDARVGGSGFLPLTGGTMTGTLSVPRIIYTTQSGAHSFAFGWTGTTVSVVLDNVILGNMALQSYVSGSFLPLSGGSLTGALYSAGEIQSAGAFRLTASGAYFFSNATSTSIGWDSNGWALQYGRSTGALGYYNGAGALLFNISGAGVVSAASTISTAGSMIASGNIYGRGGAIYWGASDRSRLSSDNSTYTSVYMLDAYRWQLLWSTGQISWLRYDDTATFTLDINGNCSIIGNFAANGSVYALNGGMYMGIVSGDHALLMGPNSYWQYSSSDANLTWIKAGVAFLSLRSTDSIALNNIGPYAGHGGYLDYSDNRGKEDIEPSSIGLDEIMQLSPIKFKRRNARADIDIGFSAQALQEIIPEAVKIVNITTVDGEYGPLSEQPRLAMSTTAIIAALVNGMKTMNERLNALEAGNGTTTH